jgi:thioesterase domain-containing protein
MIEIETAFGKTLPLSVLLDGPTIEGLAAQLGPVSEPSPLVVPLREGGTKPPVFFIHDGMGEVLLYRNLALRLRRDRPIYAIRPLSRNGCPIVHTRLGEMAACYADEIRKIQPHGPYFVAGLCTGGLIALEIARQLESEGERIGLVGLIDTPHNRARKKSVAKRRLQAFLGSSAAASGATGSSNGSPQVLGRARKKILNVLGYESRRLANEARRTILIKLLRYFVDRGGALPPIVQHIPVREVLWVAEREHTLPATFAGPVVLFRATKKSSALEGTMIGGVLVDDTPYVDRFVEAAFGWEEHLASLAVHDIPGGHSSVLMDPNAEKLAEKLQAHLDAGTRPADKDDVTAIAADAPAGTGLRASS